MGQDVTYKGPRKVRAARLLLGVLLLLPVLLLASVVDAREIWSLDESSLVYRDYFPGGSDPLITDNGLPNRTLGKGVELTLNSSIIGGFYFNNLVHSMTDEVVGTSHGQFRSVGWQFELGLRLSKTVPIDVFYGHHSQHVLDASAPFHFPVNDSFGVRLILFKRETRETLLP